MNQKQFRKYLDRDGGCVHCGETDAISPHHRLNRGMGGSKVRDVPSNIIVLCSTINGLLESDAEWASLGRQWGWKLYAWQSPLDSPYFDLVRHQWYLLDDEFQRIEMGPRRVES